MAFRLRVKLAHSELPKRLWKFDPDWTFESFSEFKEEIFKAGVGKELYEVILERAYKSWDRVDQFSGIGEVELYFGEIDGNVIIDDYEQFVEVLEKDDLLTVAVSAEMLALVKDPANALLCKAKKEIKIEPGLGAKKKKSSFIKQEPVAVAAGSSSSNGGTGGSSMIPLDLTGSGSEDEDKDEEEEEFNGKLKTGDSDIEEDDDDDDDDDGESSSHDADTDESHEDGDSEEEEGEEGLKKNKINCSRRKTTTKRRSNESEESEEDEEDSDSDFEEGGKKKRGSSAGRGKKGKAPPKKRVAKEKPTLYVYIDEKDIPHAPGGLEDEEGNNKEEVDKAHEKPDDELKAVKDRIRKMLNRGLHPEANEHEAKSSLKLAQRYLQKYNLKQADIELHEGGAMGLAASGAMKAGLVNCQLRRGIPGEDKWDKVRMQERWIPSLAGVCDANFREGKYPEMQNAYYTGRDKITFYGIESQAQLAAYAFKVGLSMVLSLKDKYAVDEDEWEDSYDNGETELSKPAYTKLARLNYCMGLCTGLQRSVRLEKERREGRKKRKMDRALLRLKRQEQNPARYAKKIEAAKIEKEEEKEKEGEEEKEGKDEKEEKKEEEKETEKKAKINDFGSDGEDNGYDDGDGYESDASSIMSVLTDVDAEDVEDVDIFKDPMLPAVAGGDDKDDKEKEDDKDEGKEEDEGEDKGAKAKVEELEKEDRASCALVLHSNTIAQGLLKDRGIKLSKGRKRKALSEYNAGAYKQGKKDSKNINLNQRAIKK